MEEQSKLGFAVVRQSLTAAHTATDRVHSSADVLDHNPAAAAAAVDLEDCSCHSEAGS